MLFFNHFPAHFLHIKFLNSLINNCQRYANKLVVFNLIIKFCFLFTHVWLKLKVEVFEDFNDPINKERIVLAKTMTILQFSFHILRMIILFDRDHLFYSFCFSFFPTSVTSILSVFLKRQKQFQKPNRMFRDNIENIKLLSYKKEKTTKREIQ